MAWKEESTMSLKTSFIKAVKEKNKSFSQICAEFGVSRQTGYNTLKQYNSYGMEGLRPASRVPITSPKKTSSEIEAKIISIRAEYSTWGARLIHAYLKKQNCRVPAVSTVSAILKRNGLINPTESLKHKAFTRFERLEPNELWQMDFKGKFLMESKEWCYPLTIIDDHSRYALCVRSCPNEQKKPVFTHLLDIFSEFGLPDQINVDNGHPWGHSSKGKHTELTIWLMRLGIKITHSRPHHPQTNGKIERFHRTLKNDVIKQNKIQNHIHAQQLFNDWREIYNHIRPHQAIQFMTPSQRFKPSDRPLPTVLKPIEYDAGAIVRKVRSNGEISYGNKYYQVGKAFSGMGIEVRTDEVQKKIGFYFCRSRILVADLL